MQKKMQINKYNNAKLIHWVIHIILRVGFKVMRAINEAEKHQRVK